MFSISLLNIIAHPDKVEDDFSEGSDDDNMLSEDDDAALDDEYSLAALDRAYEETKQCIDEGVAVLRDVSGSDGDTVMGNENFHLKRAPDRTVEELDDDEFGTMTSDLRE